MNYSTSRLIVKSRRNVCNDVNSQALYKCRMLLSEFKAETKRLDSVDKGQREEQEGKGPRGNSHGCWVRANATLEKAEKQKKSQESMTSQKSKKESGISQKGRLRCQPWPAPASVPQGTTPPIGPEKEDNFKGK